MPRYIEQMVSEQVSKSELARQKEIESGIKCGRSVITISRRMGSGARIIAQKLADELGWSIWDKDLLDAIADNAHVSQKVAKEFDEHTISEIELFARGMFGDYERAGFIYPRHLARAVKSIAKLGNAIILGRGANFLLPDALNIRIDASDERRIENMMQYEDMTRDAAIAKLHESDRERSHFVESVFGRKISESAIYDLTIWMDEFTNDGAVRIILTAIEAWCAGKQ